MIAISAALEIGFAEVIPLSEAASQFAPKSATVEIVTAEAVGSASPEFSATDEADEGIAPGERIFEIGSISKVFTALLLAQAVVEKRVTLDSTIGELLGDSQKFGDPAIAAITLRQLATHTSGLPRLPTNLDEGAEAQNPYARYDEDLLREYLASAKLEGRPPFPNAYSNLGFGLLGTVLERVYDRPWADLVAEKITGPLEMSDTVVALDAEQTKRFVPGFSGEEPARPWTFQAMAGAGALRSTAEDLVRFGKALLDPKSTPLPEAIELMMTPQGDADGTPLGIVRAEIDGRTIYEHGGGTGGYRSMLRVTPDTQTVQIVLTNNAGVDPAKVLSVARGEKPRTDESTRVLSNKQLDEYVGVYKAGPAVFTILRDGDRLMARLTGQPFCQIFPHEVDDRFFYKVVPAEIQFHRNDGAVNGMTLFQNGQQVPAERSDDKVPSIVFRDDDALAEFAGIYELLPGAEFTVKVVSGTLMVKLTGQQFAPVFETSKDHFEYDVVKAAIEFERDADGKVAALILHQHGLEQRAERKPD